jgi:hypothetical protein
MNVCVPDDTLKAVSEYAQWRQITVEEAVLEALKDWLQSAKEMKEELDMWQHARLEALRLVEEARD